MAARWWPTACPTMLVAMLQALVVLIHGAVVLQVHVRAVRGHPDLGGGVGPAARRQPLVLAAPAHHLGGRRHQPRLREAPVVQGDDERHRLAFRSCLVEPLRLTLTLSFWPSLITICFCQDLCPIGAMNGR